MFLAADKGSQTQISQALVWKGRSEGVRFSLAACKVSVIVRIRLVTKHLTETT